MRFALTIAMWCAALLGVAVAASLATALVFMASSLDPTDLVTSGVDAWADALKAVAAFAGLVVVAALGLRLWHTARFQAVGALLMLVELGGAAWACAVFYREYF